MLCRDCEHFHIQNEPLGKGTYMVDLGRAVCKKYNLTVEFRDHRKFSWLSCDDRPREDGEL